MLIRPPTSGSNRAIPPVAGKATHSWLRRRISPNVWGTARGIPSGAQKHVVERYRLADGGATVTIDYTLTDPEYLTAPISGAETWRYAPNLELLPNKCDLEIAHRYLRRD